MSSIRTVTQLMIRRTTFFAMSHSNQLEEPTFPQLMHCLLLNYMCETAVRAAGDSRRRTWGIEMNEAQETYLKNYSAVDKIDKMLLDWDLSYRS